MVQKINYLNFFNYQGREIGYVLSKDYWGKGLMPEAVNVVITYCFKVLKFDFLLCGYFAISCSPIVVKLIADLLHFDGLVGFPQETDEDHRESVDFVKKIGFSRVHVFRYSRRNGTKAAQMTGQVPENIKSERWQEMTAAADMDRERYLKYMVGKTVSVLFERENSTEFHHGYAPDYTLVKIYRKFPEKSLRNQIRSVIIEEYGHDCCFGSLVTDKY